MRYTLVLLILGLRANCLLRGVHSNVDRADNADHFGVLCRIYNVAAHPPESFPKSTELDKIIAEIDVINASLSDDEWFTKVSSTTDKEKLRGEFTGQSTEIDKYWERWSKSVAQVKEGGEYKKLPANTPSVKVAQKKLTRIEEKVEEIVTSLQKFNGEEELKNIGGFFDKAIYGDPGPTNKERPMGSPGNRATACGATGLAGKGNKAGDSLVLDLHCLCAAYETSDSTGIKNACGVDVGGDGINFWAGSLTDASGTMWKALKTGCDHFPRTDNHRPQEVQRLLDDFQSALAVGGPVGYPTTDKRKSGLLGKSAASSTNPGCDGQKGATSGYGICVYYGAKGDWKNIKWLQQMQEGVKALEKLRDHNTTIRQALIQLKLYQHQAESIYEETHTALQQSGANPGTAAHNPDQKQNPTSPSDKATAHDPNAVNNAPTPRVILPWTLFI